MSVSLSQQLSEEARRRMEAEAHATAVPVAPSRADIFVQDVSIGYGNALESTLFNMSSDKVLGAKEVPVAQLHKEYPDFKDYIKDPMTPNQVRMITERAYLEKQRKVMEDQYFADPESITRAGTRFVSELLPGLASPINLAAGLGMSSIVTKLGPKAAALLAKSAPQISSGVVSVLAKNRTSAEFTRELVENIAGVFAVDYPVGKLLTDEYEKKETELGTALLTAGLVGSGIFGLRKTPSMVFGGLRDTIKKFQKKSDTIARETAENSPKSAEAMLNSSLGDSSAKSIGDQIVDIQKGALEAPARFTPTSGLIYGLNHVDGSNANVVSQYGRSVTLHKDPSIHNSTMDKLDIGEFDVVGVSPDKLNVIGLTDIEGDVLSMAFDAADEFIPNLTAGMDFSTTTLADVIAKVRAVAKDRNLSGSDVSTAIDNIMNTVYEFGEVDAIDFGDHLVMRKDIAFDETQRVNKDDVEIKRDIQDIEAELQQAKPVIIDGQELPTHDPTWIHRPEDAILADMVNEPTYRTDLDTPEYKTEFSKFVKDSQDVQLMLEGIKKDIDMRVKDAEANAKVDQAQELDTLLGAMDTLIKSGNNRAFLTATEILGDPRTPPNKKSRLVSETEAFVKELRDFNSTLSEQETRHRQVDTLIKDIWEQDTKNMIALDDAAYNISQRIKEARRSRISRESLGDIQKLVEDISEIIQKHDFDMNQIDIVKALDEMDSIKLDKENNAVAYNVIESSVKDILEEMKINSKHVLSKYQEDLSGLITGIEAGDFTVREAKEALDMLTKDIEPVLRGDWRALQKEALDTGKRVAKEVKIQKELADIHEKIQRALGLTKEVTPDKIEELSKAVTHCLTKGSP